MKLSFSIEERPFKNLALVGTCNETSFKEELIFPKSKLSRERYVIRKKQVLKKIHNKYMTLALVIQNLESKSNEVEQPYHYLDGSGMRRRFNVSRHLNFLIIVKKTLDGEPFVSLCYEKYNRHTSFWDKVEIATYRIHKNIKEKIESDLRVEWEIWEAEEKLKGVIIHTFASLGFSILEEAPIGTYYIHRADLGESSRVLFRFRYENKQLCVLLKREKTGKHAIIFGFESKHPGYRNVIDLRENWFTATMHNLNTFPEELQKALSIVQDQKRIKMKEKNMISKLLKKLNG